MSSPQADPIREALLRLANPNSDVRCEAADFLGECEVDSTEILTRLFEVAVDPDIDVSRHACTSLGKLGSQSASYLTALLAHEQSAIRANALVGIRHLSTWPSEMASAVASMLFDICFDVRQEALISVGLTPDYSEFMIPGITHCLLDGDPNLVMFSLYALQHTGHNGAAVVPVVQRLFETLPESSFVTSLALDTLAAICTHSDTVVLAALPFLCSANSDLRISAIQALGMHATSESAAHLVLQGYLSDPDSTVREEVVEAIRQMNCRAIESRIAFPRAD